MDAILCRSAEVLRADQLCAGVRRHIRAHERADGAAGGESGWRQAGTSTRVLTGAVDPGRRTSAAQHPQGLGGLDGALSRAAEGAYGLGLAPTSLRVSSPEEAGS